MGVSLKIFVFGLTLLLFLSESFANNEVAYAHREAQKDKERAAGAQKRAERDRYLKNPLGHCLKNPRVPNETSVKVNQYDRQLCKDFWLGDSRYYGGNVNYTIKKSNGRISVDVDTKLIYKGNPRNQVEVMNSISNATHCVERFYARYGIYLDLKFVFTSPQRNSKALQINVYDECERSNSGNWCVLKDVGIVRTNNSLCSMIAHEIGHNLGLPDRYQDEACPDRPNRGPRSNLMNGGGVENIWDLKLSTDDVAIIAAPLCDK